MKIKKSSELVNLCVTAAVLIFSLIAMLSLCVSFSWFFDMSFVTAEGLSVSAKDNDVEATIACYSATVDGSTYAYNTGSPSTTLPKYTLAGTNNKALVLVLTVNGTFSGETAHFSVHRDVNREGGSYYTEESTNFFSNVVRFTTAMPGTSPGGDYNAAVTTSAYAESVTLINGTDARTSASFDTALVLDGSNPTFYFIIEYNMDFLSRFSAKFGESAESGSGEQSAIYQNDIYFTLD